jgi:orotidine-5'-phosphate decarboxylase
MSRFNQSKIIVALDYANEQDALYLVEQLPPSLCRLKVGKELFVSAGPKLIEILISKGFDVFLDLKFHDIPNTVAHACVAAAKLGVWMLTLHALGGPQMLQAAQQAVQALSSSHKPLLIGVTLLTSLQQSDLAAIGLEKALPTHSLQLARLCYQASLNGVVCSGQEASSLRKEFAAPFKLVTPGIRFNPLMQDDQQRIVTPQQALENGADYLVIGRPITQAENPVKILEALNKL